MKLKLIGTLGAALLATGCVAVPYDDGYYDGGYYGAAPYYAQPYVSGTYIYRDYSPPPRVVHENYYYYDRRGNAYRYHDHDRHSWRDDNNHRRHGRAWDRD